MIICQRCGGIKYEEIYCPTCATTPNYIFDIKDKLNLIIEKLNKMSDEGGII